MTVQLAVRCALFALLAAASATPAHAQATRAEQAAHSQLLNELGRLRQATSLEASGDIAGAEKIVRGILDGNPTSLSALLTLERLLGVTGRMHEITAPIDRLLELDPQSVVGHQTRLRVLAQAKNHSGMDAAANAWIRAMPKIETPYREIALVWRQQGENAKAISLLEQGRKRIERPDALALELGDAFIAAGDLHRAAVEWARAVGPEGRGFLLIQRRLQNLPDGGAQLIPPLVEQLAGPPRSAGRLRAATLLAIDAGLAPRAQKLAGELIGGTPAAERDPVLVELARRADGAGLYRIASWAYGEMLRDGRDAGAALAIRSRLAELALLAGDTATAAEVYLALERASAAGSPQRRQALALRVQLVAREGDLARATTELNRLRREFPQAPELDQAAAYIGERYLASGDAAAAERVLDSVTGPRAAQLRGRIALGRGDLNTARDELLSAAPLLRGAEATETIGLAALVTRLTPQAGELLAHVVSASPETRTERLRTAVSDARALPERERAAIFDFLAAAAERAGLNEDADELRREIVTVHPRTQEAPAALWALARRALARPDADEQARLLLEKVIVDYPRSALVPQARRELERLHSRISIR